MSDILGGAIDERSLMHRLRSTSAAAVVGGMIATLLFAYRYYVHHVWSWDLLAVSLAMVVTKCAPVASQGRAGIAPLGRQPAAVAAAQARACAARRLIPSGPRAQPSPHRSP